MLSLFQPFDWFFFSNQFLLMFLIPMITMNWMSMGNLKSTVLSTSSVSAHLMILNILGVKISKNYLQFILTIFMLILTKNLYSNLAYIYPWTCRLSSLILISLSFWMCMLMFSIRWSSKMFLAHLVPEGAPSLLIPLLLVIEVVSIFIRWITLTVRIAANILAGHLILILVSSLVLANSYSFPIFMALNLVELGVAFIQAYIFITLLTLYYQEA